jgi:hypothetical protein
LWGPGGRRRAGESGEERHLLRKDGYLPLPIASARPALAFVSAHVIAELRLHLGTAHDLAPKVTPAVIGLHVCHLQGFVHPFGHALGDLLPMRVSAASNQSKCSATSCPPRHVGMPDETNPRAGTFGAKIAQAAAGRRSGNIASRQRRGRRVNNRKSFSFSSEALAGVRITHRHQKETQPEGQQDDIQHEVLLRACLRARRLRVPGKKIAMDQRTINVWSQLTISCQYGRTTIRYGLGLPVNTNMPDRVFQPLKLYPQPVRMQSGGGVVEYLPVERRNQPQSSLSCSKQFRGSQART